VDSVSVSYNFIKLSHFLFLSASAIDVFQFLKTIQFLQNLSYKPHCSSAGCRDWHDAFLSNIFLPCRLYWNW